MTKTVFRVLGVLASLAVGGAASAADSPTVEWKVSDGGNGHWYQFSNWGTFSTWQAANQAATSKGAHLVTLQSAQEEDFVRSLVGSGSCAPESSEVLIGGYQPDGSQEPGGGWRWVTDEPFTYTNWRSTPGQIEPNNAGQSSGNVEWTCLINMVRGWNDGGDGMGCAHSALFEYSADCNGDGSVDYGQIKSGELADTNHNNIPDVCELVITSVQPISGASIGGTAVKINGNNFPISPIVTFGGVSATDIVRVSPSLITAVTPAGTPGMTMVAVNSASSESFYYRPNCGSDLDNNGVVDSADVGIVLLDIGNCSESLTTPQEQEPLIFQTTQTPVLNKK